jgi:hypothetical protein
MGKILEELAIRSWEEPTSHAIQRRAIENLEHGSILYLPNLAFPLSSEEHLLLTSDKVDPKRKNISYDSTTDLLGGSLWEGEEGEKLKEMLNRYARLSSRFLQHLFPHYLSHLSLARTSFRPVEISGRKSSPRKDDTRLHVDAFPSKPTQGKRILRLFTNVNLEGKARVWKVGEPFEQVVQQFACKVPPPLLGSATLLKLLRITKERRTLYDHYMLHIHDRMKEDDHYQRTVSQEEISFPPGSSWIVFTDLVSHAALSGQCAFEQTCTLPVSGLKEIGTAPLKILENHLHRSLI